MKSIRVLIEGTTKMLQNRFTDAAALAAEPGAARPLSTASRGTPREQAEQRLYTDENGKVVIPSPNLFRCFIDAGQHVKVGKKTLTTAKTSILAAYAQIEGELIPIRGEAKWDVDSRAVRNPATGGRFLCHRPAMPAGWQASFVLSFDESALSESLMREVVEVAGKRVGLGDFRPACKGPFGKFQINEWKAVKS